jgi:Zn-dependent protease
MASPFTAPASGALLRFRVLGVPVRVEVGFLLMTVLLAGDRRNAPEALGLWFGVVFVSVLLHEMGHALVGRRFGLTPDVRLYGWGGLTSWTAGEHPGHARRLAISVAGPLVGMAVGLAAYLARGGGPGGGRLAVVLDDLVWASGVWGVINLAPLLPLDGGNALEAAWGMVAPLSAEQGARVVSCIAGLALGLCALDAGWLMPGVFALWLGADSARRLLAVRRDRHDQALIERWRPIFHAAIDAGDGAALAEAAGDALAEARPGRARAWILENLAVGRAMLGEIDAAVDALAWAPPEHPPAVRVQAFVVRRAVERARDAAIAALGTATPVHTSPDPWEEAVALLRTPPAEPLDAVRFGHVREAAAVLRMDGEAARIGERMLEAAPDPDLAFAVAVAWTRAGHLGRAREAAAQAVALGFRDWERAGELAGEAFAEARRAS